MRVNGDTDTGGDEQLVAVDMQRSGEILEDLAGHLLYIFLGAETADEDGKFVPSHAGHRVDLPYAFGQPGGDFLQQLVAKAVPKAIIDDLEAIKIEKKNGHLLVQPFSKRPGLFQPIQKEQPVGETGQDIMVRHMIKLLLCQFALRDITANTPDNRIFAVLGSAGKIPL